LVHLLRLRNSDFFLVKDVDIAQKHHVLALNPLVRFLVELFALFESLSYVIYVGFHSSTSADLVISLIRPSNLVIGFVKHVDAMKAFDTLLQLLVVVKVVVEHFIDLILELLLNLFLMSDLADTLSLLFLHTFTLQLHILDDEPEVLIDDGEMLGLILHLGLLLDQSLHLLLTRSDTRPKLLNLVIEDEFELLELLRLLSVLINLVLLVFNSTFALL